MASVAADERIGIAWRMHREGNNSGAISLFDEVIRSSPEDIDAHYGRGLALKAIGDVSAARDSFSSALSYLQNLGSEQESDPEEGHVAQTDDSDRQMMLTRMVNQRLDDLSDS